MVNILIVDDEVQLARNIATYLESFPGLFAVRVAASGEEALEILDRDPVDLLLTDVRLPGIDGVQLLRQAVAHHPRLKVIVMTAYGSAEVRYAATHSGAFRFIEKPLDLEELRQLIHQARPGERGWSGQVGGLDIFDVTQLLVVAGKSRALRVRYGKHQGVMIFEKGTLVHASTGKLSGEEAFHLMATWEGGAFEEMHTPSLERYPPNVKVSSTHLMMETARLRDESSRGARGSEKASSSDVAGIGNPSADASPAEGDDALCPEKEKPMAIRDHLNELQGVEGFQGAAVYSSSGEMLDGFTAGSLDIKTIGMFANNALLNAQKATDSMGVGRGNMVQIRAPQATVIMRCLNEATDFAATAAGKAHFHTVCVLGPDGNVGMAAMLVDKIVAKVADEVR